MSDESHPSSSEFHHLRSMFSTRGKPGKALSPAPQLFPGSAHHSYQTPSKAQVSSHGDSGKDHNVAPDKWSAAVSNLDTSQLVKLFIDELAKVPYKKKRDFGVSGGDNEIAQELLSKMKDLLGNKFLSIDFKSAARNVTNTDWSRVTACRRSESGTIGIYFIQCSVSASSAGAALTRSITPNNNNRSKSPAKTHSSESLVSLQDNLSEIIVAKPVSKEDFERQLFVNEIIKEYFKIHCPAIRFITKTDEEFAQLEESVKKLFQPFHSDLYTSGGQGSPKALFEGHSIMLMELVKGKPLCHRTEGQRILKDEDFRAIGRMYLLDLLIRNTDRFPSRKALPRPGSVNISDHGNAGNLMFGDVPGSLWAIDPEMQTNIDTTREIDYMKSLESILLEILNDEISLPRYKALDSLYFNPIPGLSGIIDVSLEEFTPWSHASPIQQEALASILAMIRARAHAEDGAIIVRAGGLLPPESSNEREWREWIRFAAPRAVIDVLKFVEVYTGYKCPPTAAMKFQQGFLEALSGAIDFQREAKSPFGSMAVRRQSLFKVILESGQIDVGFVRRMIDGLAKVCPEPPYESPVSTCDVDKRGPERRIVSSGSKKKFISAAKSVASPSSKRPEKDFDVAAASFISTLSVEIVKDLPTLEDRKEAATRTVNRTSPPTSSK